MYAKILALIVAIAAIFGCSCENREAPPQSSDVVADKQPSAVDDIATLTFKAPDDSNLTVQPFEIRLEGSTLQTPQLERDGVAVTLIDPMTNVMWGSSVLAIAMPKNGVALALFAPNYVVSAGTTKTVKVRVNSAQFLAKPGVYGLKVYMDSKLVATHAYHNYD
jgi:hypothetical protein